MAFNYIKVRDVKSPVRGTPQSAGIDFFIPNDFTMKALGPGEDILIPSGIVARVPENCMLMAADKSGVVTSANAMIACGKEPKNTQFGSVVTIGAKIVDEDYQGEIHIHLVNVGRNYVSLRPGMKITQFIIVPVFYDEPNELSSREELFHTVTKRGEGGFSSTGRN